VLEMREIRERDAKTRNAARRFWRVKHRAGTKPPPPPHYTHVSFAECAGHGTDRLLNEWHYNW